MMREERHKTIGHEQFTLGSSCSLSLNRRGTVSVTQGMTIMPAGLGFFPASTSIQLGWVSALPLLLQCREMESNAHWQ